MVLGVKKKKTKSTIGRKRMYNVGKLLRVRQFIKKKKKLHVTLNLQQFRFELSLV